jgi:hypothetical protein
MKTSVSICWAVVGCYYSFVTSTAGVRCYTTSATSAKMLNNINWRCGMLCNFCYKCQDVKLHQLQMLDVK